MEKKIDPSSIEPKVQKKSDTVWIIELEEDPDTGDLIMPLPGELLEAQGWKIGDTLNWSVDEETRTATLVKKK